MVSLLSPSQQLWIVSVNLSQTSTLLTARLETRRLVPLAFLDNGLLQNATAFHNKNQQISRATWCLRSL